MESKEAFAVEILGGRGGSSLASAVGVAARVLRESAQE